MAIVSIMDSICNKLVIFKRLNVSCCNKIEESKVSIDDFTDGFYDFDCESEFILRSHNLISSFYDRQDIGKFVTNIDGICVYANDKVSEMFGAKKNMILYHHIYSININTNDFTNTVKAWQTALVEKRPLLYKERRSHGSANTVYLIVEAHPYYSDNGWLGMHGVFVRVTKQVWNKFYSNLEDSKEIISDECSRN